MAADLAMQTSTGIRCPICDSDQVTSWKPRNLDRPLRPEDFKITDSRYGVTLKLDRCESCSFIFADRVEIANLTGYYERLEDPEYENGAVPRTLQMRWLLQLGRTARKNARQVLEIGAGAGLLIAEARRAGLDAVGVEPSRSLVSEALRLHGVELLNGTFPHPQLRGRQFDLLFLVDVIEHLEDPVGLLMECAKALKPDGVMVMVTPNVSSVAARLLRHRWWHLRLAHVGYFNDRSMREACNRAGLEIQSSRTAKWFFPVRYVAERVAVYLPLRWFNNAAEIFARFAGSTIA